ncbi:fungal-specific transcription factor domain-containing protein [Sporodiniella umbellata]|nr:fungal-specific transcription factor domain-containing protein [Sporodiniella umbellata]
MGKSNQELKYKRLKVGHACYVCRSKKIKCDGLRPCMQCKARGRNCVSSKEELLAQESPEACKDSLDTSSCSESDDDSILFSTGDKSLHPISPHASICYESWSSHSSISIAEDQNEENEYPLFGGFVHWTAEPPLPTGYSHPIEMPTADIQMHLINLFFETYHTSVPMIPKAFFFEQLRVKGPLITPLLLNAIYCTVSESSTLLDVPKSSVFFNRCKKLLDDFLDVPRVSTVIALCLLSCYEPSPARGKADTTSYCRAWMYGGMASRMCLELGLNVDTPATRKGLGTEDIEIRRRVFWVCYIFDKVQSREWERTWTLPSSLANTHLPESLPTEDKEERRHLLAFSQLAHLSVIAEEGLQIRSLYAISGKINMSSVHQQLEQYHTSVLRWLQDAANTSFAPEEISFSRNRLIAYFMLNEVLILLPKTSERVSKQGGYVAELIRLADTICHHSFKVTSYEVLAHSVGSALQAIKSGHLEASLSHECIAKSLKIFTTIQQRAMIPKFSETVRYINTLYRQSRKNQQETKKKTQESPLDQASRSACLEEPQQEFAILQKPLVKTEALCTPTEKQPWLQALYNDANQTPIPLTPEDSLQFSTLSSPDQGEQLWTMPSYLSDTAFPSEGCQAQSYFASFPATSHTDYIASYDPLYMNESYNYLPEHLETLTNAQAYPPLYYTN